MDWDATCVHGVWPDMGGWLPGAERGLRALLGAGYEVVIHTTRIAPMEIDEVTPRADGAAMLEFNTIRRMLDQAGLGSVSIWQRPWKPGAHAYVDDKAVEFTGDWPAVVRRLCDSETSPEETVCQEADRLISGDRNGSYGKAIDDFTRTGKMWAAILGLEEVSAHQVALCMAALKISREAHKHKRDNVVDGCGYLALANEVCVESG